MFQHIIGFSREKFRFVFFLLILQNLVLLPRYICKKLEPKGVVPSEELNNTLALDQQV